MLIIGKGFGTGGTQKKESFNAKGSSAFYIICPDPHKNSKYESAKGAPALYGELGEAAILAFLQDKNFVWPGDVVKTINLMGKEEYTGTKSDYSSEQLMLLEVA